MILYICPELSLYKPNHTKAFSNTSLSPSKDSLGFISSPNFQKDSIPLRIVTNTATFLDSPSHHCFQVLRSTSSKVELMAVKKGGIIEGSLPEELVKILSSLAAHWGDVIDIKALKVIHLKGAMTNEVYAISWPTMLKDESRTVLVRIYGEGVDRFFNRSDEIRIFEYMSIHGHGPQLLGRFPEGRVEEFIHARTLSAEDLRDPQLSDQIAAKLREFHNLDMPGLKNVVLWDRMRNWLSQAKALCSPDNANEFCLDGLDKEISVLEKELSKDHLDIGFCHNDLQYGNIMIDEETKAITMIDYEYASYNPIAYDLANHFCEMVANYHSEKPHVLDYSKYPGLEERQRFVQAYLSSVGHQPNEREVEQLVNKAEKCTLANHLFWGLWGIISAYVNNIEFDYMEYARQRFHQYWLRKPQLLSLSEFPPHNSINGFAEHAT